MLSQQVALILSCVKSVQPCEAISERRDKLVVEIVVDDIPKFCKVLGVFNEAVVPVVLNGISNFIVDNALQDIEKAVNNRISCRVIDALKI